MNVRELLIKSAELLEQRELVKGIYCSGRYDDPDAMCSYGAITYAVTGNADYSLLLPVERAIIDSVALELAQVVASDPIALNYISAFETVTRFNDDVNTTKEMVVAKMREAADNAW